MLHYVCIIHALWVKLYIIFILSKRNIIIIILQKFLGLPQFISPRHFTFNKTKGFPCIVMDLPPNMSTGTGFHGPRQDPMDVNPNNPTRIGSPGLLDSSRPGPPPKPDTSPPKIHCLGSTKGRDHPEVNSETFGILKEFFRPFNHKFFRMIGRRFVWN